MIWRVFYAVDRYYDNDMEDGEISVLLKAIS